MKHPFILIEDADIAPDFADALAATNPEWELNYRKITDAASYSALIALLQNPLERNLVAAFDLDYRTAAGTVTSTPHWDGMDEASKAAIPAQTKYGVNALLCLLKHFNQGNLLIVVSSAFTGDTLDSGKALRSEIQKIAEEKGPAAVIHAYFPGGPLTVEKALLVDRLGAIKAAWDSFFGAMASRLRSSQNAGWFNDCAPQSPAHMIHAHLGDSLNADDIKNDVTQWLASVSDTSERTVKPVINALFAADGFGFYKHAIERVTGACSLHCGRSSGKPLNMHGVALIACCYATDFASIFGGISWISSMSADLLSSSASVSDAEALLYALVGNPATTTAAQPSGVFEILGIHDGKDGGTKGCKTVTLITLEQRKVEVTFAVRGTGLVAKYKSGGATGNAYCALITLKNILASHGVSTACMGTDSTFTLTLSKP